MVWAERISNIAGNSVNWKTMVLTCKIEHNLRPSNSTPRYILKRNPWTFSLQNIFRNEHRNTVNSSRKLESTINRKRGGK